MEISLNMGEKIEEGTFQNLSSLLFPEMAKCVLLQRHEDLSIEISQMLHASIRQRKIMRLHFIIMTLPLIPDLLQYQTLSLIFCSWCFPRASSTLRCCNFKFQICDPTHGIYPKDAVLSSLKEGYLDNLPRYSHSYSAIETQLREASSASVSFCSENPNPLVDISS